MSVLMIKIKSTMKRILLLILPLAILASCDFLDPRPIEDLKTEELWSHADFGEGILTTVYIGLEDQYNIELENYTDNAIPAVPGSNKLALGSWTLENNSIGTWGNDYTYIKYLNLFIENGRDLPYNVTDVLKDSIYRSNRLGEAFGLRAWFEWKLLQTYGGMVEGESEAMGFPIVTTVLEQNDELDIPRNTYEECVAQIVADCDSAIRLLPIDYTDPRNAYIGIKNRGRMSGLIAKMIKARAYLYAASPAFGNSTQANWERAAKAAADAINATKGLTDLKEYGNFNDGASFDNIWISEITSNNQREKSYYPPSLFGNGSTNPSQNLIDAFPASDGYPIEKSAIYSATDPYKNRDPRFGRFIFFNGDNYASTTIQTYNGGLDAPGGLSQLGTRTGYYLKKFTSKNVTLNPGTQVTDFNFVTYMSRAELYLIFAEAANEAYGPLDNSLGFSATDALKVVRKRALGNITDNYLTEQANAGKDAFRQLIQNERRIELCFEGHRFWDVRRWNLPLEHTIKGVKITNADGNFSYQYVDIENHQFEDYQRFVPVPYDQTLIMTKLKQNSGWK
jgi:hypothetical protein